MAVTRNSYGTVDQGTDEGPDEAWHSLRPMGHDLEAEGDAVDIGAIVGDDRKGENDEAEFAETT